MKTKVIKTEIINVEISDAEFIRLLSKVLDKTFDFNPSEEYIENGYICYDVKYHTWSKERRREATDKDLQVKELFLDIVEKLERP